MTGAALLRQAILERGRVEGDILKVDDFLNHRVEPDLLAEIGADMAAMFPRPDVVLTAEASGIPPGLAVATVLGIPMIYAKKYLGPGTRHAFSREVLSTTKGVEYRVEVGRRMLPAGLDVLVIDDFLAGGRTAEALGQITAEAACSLVGMGFVVEKAFAGGRDRLEAHGWDVRALVTIESLAGGVVTLAD